MEGWLCLIGGGEFSFGETAEADQAWLEKTRPGPIGFVPAASGSADYGRHFAEYMDETFARRVETLPVYRPRDGRRVKNAERLSTCAAVYLGGGVADQLFDAIAGSVVAEALRDLVAGGGVVIAIAAAAQACGVAFRTLRGTVEQGLGLAPGTVIEPNFDPAHDRRLRSLMSASGAPRGLGIPAGAALMVGPEGRFEALGDLFALAGPNADIVPFVPLEGTPGDARA